MAVDRITQILEIIDRATGPLREITKSMLGLGVKSEDIAGGIKSDMEKNIAAMTAYGKSVSDTVGQVKSMAMGSMIYQKIKEGVVDLNAKAEETNIKIAGMMRVQGVGRSWDDAMKIAGKAMDKIRAKSAVLPGDADDYVQILDTVLPKALEAGFNPDKIVDFSAQWGAVAASFKVDAVQAGADASRMLQGQVGADVAMWTKLEGTFKKIGVSGAGAFKKLSKSQRAAKMFEAVKNYDEMIKAYGGTWETATSTFTSGIKDITRAATAPIFEAAKGTLTSINDILAKITPALISTLADGFKAAIDGAKGLLGKLTEIAASPAFKMTMGVIVGKLSAGAASVTGGAAGAEGGVGGMAGNTIKNLVGAAGAVVTGLSLLSAGLVWLLPVFTPLAGIVGPLVGVFALLAGGMLVFMQSTSAVTSVLSSLSGIVGSVMMVIAPLAELFWSLSDMIGSGLIAMLPPLLDILSTVFGWLAIAFTGMMMIINPVVAFLGLFWKAITGIIGAVWRFYAIIFKIADYAFKYIFSVFMKLYAIIADYVTPIFDKVHDAIVKFIEWLNTYLDTIGAAISVAADKLIPGGPRKEVLEPDMVDPEELQYGPAAAWQKKTAPPTKTKGDNYNDFRGSKFDIKQNFATGFDPDRIAVAFTDDLVKVGERRLQSGLGGVFGVR